MNVTSRDFFSLNLNGTEQKSAFPWEETEKRAEEMDKKIVLRYTNTADCSVFDWQHFNKVCYVSFFSFNNFFNYLKKFYFTKQIHLSQLLTYVVFFFFFNH